MKARIEYLAISVLSLLLAFAGIHFNSVLGFVSFILVIPFTLIALGSFIYFLKSIEGGVVVTYLKNMAILIILTLLGISFGFEGLRVNSSTPFAGIGFGFAFVCIILVAAYTYDFARKMTKRGE